MLDIGSHAATHTDKAVRALLALLPGTAATVKAVEVKVAETTKSGAEALALALLPWVTRVELRGFVETVTTRGAEAMIA